MHYKVVLAQLSLKYDIIWIPQFVETEFTDTPFRNNRRVRMLKQLKEQHAFIKTCPINVSRQEIEFDNGNSSEDIGETDAMLQCAKLLGIRNQRFRFSDVCLFFKDKGAIHRAKKKQLPLFLYSDFASQLLEIGVVLP